MSILLDILFPKYCIGCKKWGSYICNSCFKGIDFIREHECPICLQPSPLGMTHTRCRTTYGLDGSISLMKYHGFTKRVIRQTKYQLMFAVLEDLFKKLPRDIIQSTTTFISNAEPVSLQPIPLHPLREKQRGFNQSEHIAKMVSEVTHAPLTHALRRIKNTKPQAQIRSKQERRENMHQAFEVCNKVTGKSIIVVDDIYTTGSTTKEAASILKKAGATNVFSFTVAHG